MSRSSIAERFKPSVPERLKQSLADKEASRVRKKPVRKEKPKPVVNVTPVNITLNNQTLTRLEVRTVSAMQTLTGYREHKRDIWHEWSNGISFATTTNTDCWDSWVTGYHTNCATNGLVETWMRWQTSDGQTGYARSPGGLSMGASYGQGIGGPRIEVAESEEMKRARLEREARWKTEQEAIRKQEAERARIRAEADGRAMELLKSCMTQEQWESLCAVGFFYVKAKSGRKYRIDRGTHGNVKVVDKDNKVIERLCIQPGGVPVGDSMLAQKLLIETAEDVFRRHANITLNNGQIIHSTERGLLDSDKLAPVINIFTKEAVKQSVQPIARIA